MQETSNLIRQRHQLAVETSNRLGEAKQHLPVRDHDEIDALRLRLLACNTPANWFIADEAVNYDTGEVYEARGQYWNCNSKLCTNCVARTSAKRRQQIRQILQNQDLTKSERYYFVTFTIKNPNLPLRQTRDLVNRAWNLFMKRSLCVDSIKGGVKSEEFTLTPNGFHYHIHALIRSRWLLYGELRRTWTDCVGKAFDDEGLELGIDRTLQTLRIDFRQVGSIEGSIQEVCKYITKSDSWSKLKTTDLAEIAMIRRWFRMFETFGCFKLPKEINEQSEADGFDSDGYVHTKSLSSVETEQSPRYWRDILASTTLTRYKEILFSEIESTRTFRTEQLRYRWPQATIKSFATTPASTTIL